MKPLLALLLLISCVKVNAASFDCTLNSLSSIEQLICTDNDLSRVDSTLSKLYKVVISKPRDLPDFSLQSSQKIKSTQLLWLKKRNICQDKECLIEVYSHRIEQLSDLIYDKNVNSGSNKVKEILDEFLQGTTYGVSSDIEIPFFYQSRGVIRLIFQTQAEGAFAYFRRSGQGWCGGDNDFMVGYLEFDLKKGLRKKKLYIGNPCPPDMAVPRIVSDENGIHIIAYSHVRDKSYKLLTVKELWSEGFTDHLSGKKVGYNKEGILPLGYDILRIFPN